jgi:hypothetical protein
MRKQVRGKIADLSKNKKISENMKFREERRDEADYIEKLKHIQKNPKQPRASKTRTDQDRTYKLLSRGIPSHFYKNLNKSQN